MCAAYNPRTRILLDNYNKLFVPVGIKAADDAPEVVLSNRFVPFDQRVFDVLAIYEASSEPVVEDAVDELVMKAAAVTVHRNSE